METLYYILVVATILIAVAATVKNIIGYRRIRQRRKEWHAYIRAVYESRGQEPPRWAKK